MNEPALAADVRGRISRLIRERQDALTGDVATAAGTGRTILAPEDRRAFAETVDQIEADRANDDRHQDTEQKEKHDRMSLWLLFAKNARRQ